jgi:hypothetical protein
MVRARGPTSTSRFPKFCPELRNECGKHTASIGGNLHPGKREVKKDEIA